MNATCNESEMTGVGKNENSLFYYFDETGSVAEGIAMKNVDLLKATREEFFWSCKV